MSHFSDVFHGNNTFYLIFVGITRFRDPYVLAMSLRLFVSHVLLFSLSSGMDWRASKKCRNLSEIQDITTRQIRP